jgi:hypothetical protein
VFRPSSHFGIYAASYIAGATALTVAGFLAYGNLWAYQPDSGLPWIVPVAHRCGIIVFSVIGWLAILRSTRFVKSMDLVSVDGVVKLVTEVRRPLPFLPPRRIVTAPYALRMDYKFVAPLEYPEWMQHQEESAQRTVPTSNTQAAGDSAAASSKALRPSPLTVIARTISKAFYYPFASTRRLLTREGFMFIEFEGVKGKMLLDTQGRFSNAGDDLVAMGLIVR